MVQSIATQCDTYPNIGRGTVLVTVTRVALAVGNVSAS